MKRLLLVIACLGLAGCDYTVSLVDSPEMKIDSAVVGVWDKVQDGKAAERLLTLPLGEREYLVSYSAMDGKEVMYAKGWPCRCAGLDLVQLQWIGTAKGKPVGNSPPFQYAAYEVEGQELRVRLLNPAVVAKNVASAAELAKAIEAAKDAPGLFRKAMVFRKGE